MAFDVAVVQFCPDKGDVSGNLKRVGAAVRQASAEGADLVVFPEACLTGYFLEAGVDELAVGRDALLERMVQAIGPLERQVDVALGFYEATDTKSTNSAAYLSLGPDGDQLLNVYRKFFPPTYHVFDESRFVTWGDELGVVETRFGKVGVLICEDMWHSVMPSLLAVAGCDMLLVHAATPARGFADNKPANLLRYESLASAVCLEHGFFVALSMLVGFEGGKGLTGGSMVVGPDGNVVVQAPDLGEAALMATVDLELCTQARRRSPQLADLMARWHDVVACAKRLDPAPDPLT
ncbi:MAG: beta-ureidopropionase [Armatimonadetes bacterium]|nr:beta-ureidopropionase [Armatimonadota bacterium]